jgi:hypothetical protein
MGREGEEELSGNDSRVPRRYLFVTGYLNYNSNTLRQNLSGKTRILQDGESENFTLHIYV